MTSDRRSRPLPGKIGATGRQVEERVSTAGDRIVYRFRQAGVHDFAWTADPGLPRRARPLPRGGAPRRGPDAPPAAGALPPGRALPARGPGGDLRLRPRPRRLSVRHADDRRSALGRPRRRGDGVPDAHHVRHVGLRARRVHSPEGVTIHEFGHQYFYGMLASNEFEEPYLDEGFNTYMTDRVLAAVYGPNHPCSSIFRIDFRSDRCDYPVDANRRASSRRKRRDIHAAWSWKFRDSAAYAGLSYSHTALALATLERLTTNVMDRALRLYFERWKFRHPHLPDFAAAVNETTGGLDLVLRSDLLLRSPATSTTRSSRHEHAREASEGALRKGREALGGPAARARRGLAADSVVICHAPRRDRDARRDPAALRGG